MLGAPQRCDNRSVRERSSVVLEAQHVLELRARQTAHAVHGAPLARRRRWRGTLAAGLLAIVAMGCSGTHNVGLLLARNESSAPVTFTVTTSTTGLLAGLNTRTYALPPWSQPRCPAAGDAFFAWPLTVTVAGPSVTAPVTKTWGSDTVGDIFVRVDASGVVHLGEPPPTDFANCKPYQFQ